MLGCPRVSFCANAFDPHTHRPVPVNPEMRRRYGGPVGFVGSAQAKQELIDRPRGMSYLVVRGRRGGSAMAAAAVNAIANDSE